jgi:hypothetical protein
VSALLAGFALRSNLLPGLVAALVMVGVLVGMFAWGHHSASSDLEAKHKAALDEMTAKHATALAAAQQAAREAEQKSIQDMAALAADYHERERHAENRIAVLDAAVRAGDVRLRQRFTCPAAAGGGGQAQAGATATGAAADLPRGFGEEDARAAVRIADEGDQRTRLLNWCIGQLKADREQ